MGTDAEPVDQQPLEQPPWIRPTGDPPVGGWSDSPRLVCFPHSGGSESFYRPWFDGFPAAVGIVQYPGRADRLVEDPVDSVEQSASAVLDELSDHGSPTTLFGHSIGALIAFETARMAVAAEVPVNHLVVSGCRAPTEAPSTTHTLDDAHLWAEVASLGGIDPRLDENSELRQLLLPALRADIRASETYRPAATASVLDCPVTVVVGRNDPLVDRSTARPWSHVTNGPFQLIELAGRHFPDPDEVGVILDALSEAAGVPMMERQ